MRGVALLGSTGSIGGSTLNVLRRHPDQFRMVAMTGGANHELFSAQMAEWRPAFAGLTGAVLPGCASGPDCLVEAATHPDADIVVNAVVGFAGLDATLAALRAGKRVALANKESLVAGGPLVLDAARVGGGELVPIDSEHSAVLQCLASREAPPTRVTLTASGGPFRDWDAGRIRSATVSEALQHPTWRMGPKITIDSATLANKALEIIEAHFLFGLPYDAMSVVVHPQSIVHALVEFTDGSVLSQMGFPTMELPILYSLTHPARWHDGGTRRFDPVGVGALTFEAVRTEVFPSFRAGIAAGRAGGMAPVAFNAANETAVAAFLAGQITFGRIAEVIQEVLASRSWGSDPITDVPGVRAADADARRCAEEFLT